MRDIGKNIKQLRIQQGMTQEEFAAKLFVTRQTISNYENGRSRPDLDSLVRIAEALQTDANTVLYGLPKTEVDISRRKRFWIGLGIALGLLALYVLCFQLAKNAENPFHVITLRYFIKVALLPCLLAVAGWTVAQELSLCNILKPLRVQRERLLRWSVASVIIALYASLVPYTVWLGIAQYRALTQSEVSMQFPAIPVYTPILESLLKMIVKVPWVYVLPGFALWMVKLPAHQSKQKLDS